MEEKTLNEHKRLAEQFCEKNVDEKRELIYLISVLLKEHGGDIDFHTEEGYDEEDLTMVLAMDEFGYHSHTYVVERLKLDEMNRVSARISRYDYEGFSKVREITLWEVSVDSLTAIYQEMTNLIEEEMEEESNEEK